MGVVFGLASYKGAVSGLRLQRVTYGESASTAEALDEDGNIEQTDVYGKKKTIQCEGNVAAGSDFALTVGAELTVGGDKFKIDNVSITESVNGHKTASISGSAPIKSNPNNNG